MQTVRMQVSCSINMLGRTASRVDKHMVLADLVRQRVESKSN